MNTEKNLQRRIIKELKHQIDVEQKEQKSDDIFRQVEELTAFKNAATILAYWSLPDEVQTQSFILRWYTKKRVVLPLVNGDDLDLRIFTGMDCMVKGSSFGITEPLLGPKADETSIDFAIIPGIAFDSKNNRLGRGKGYYDKLLSKNNFFKVGVCFSFQLLEEVKVDSFDVPMNLVVSA